MTHASTSQPDLDALFEASLAGYRSASTSKPKTKKRHFDADEDVIRLDDGNEGSASDKKRTKAAKKDSTSQSQPQPPTPTSHTRLAGQDKGKGLIAQHLDELDRRVPSTSSSSSKKQRQQRNTAGSQWYDMPAFPTSDDAKQSKTGHGASSGKYVSSSRGPTAEEMRREVQAIRLRNALDPKRFYKGGAKNAKDKGMPQFAQLGKIISSPLEPNNTLTRAERGNTVIEELMKDAQTAAYAKRKYGEHQVRTSAGGKGHYKAKSKKPGDRKRMRK